MSRSVSGPSSREHAHRVFPRGSSSTTPHPQPSLVATATLGTNGTVLHAAAAGTNRAGGAACRSRKRYLHGTAIPCPVPERLARFGRAHRNKAAAGHLLGQHQPGLHAEPPMLCTTAAAGHFCAVVAACSSRARCDARGGRRVVSAKWEWEWESEWNWPPWELGSRHESIERPMITI